MEQKVISGIEGVGLYGILSIGIFFAFFSGVLIWAFSLKKKHLQHMGGLPLDGCESIPEKTSPQNYE
jgi:hypothetical protein